jgi:asparagine synthase (glutamine-hydrolysing)
VLARGIDAVGIFDHTRRRALDSGLHARHPFLDVDLIEFALAMPPEITFDPSHSRLLFRESLDGILPDVVRLRRGKTQFSSISYEHLAGPERDAALALVGRRDGRLLARGLVDEDRLRRHLLRGPEHHPRSVLGWTDELWRLAAAEIWLSSREDPAEVSAILAEHAVPATRSTLVPSGVR